MKRLLTAALVMLLAVPTACAEGEVPTGSKPGRDVKAELEILLKENPDLVLDVLKENSVQVLEIVRYGAALQQKQQQREQWELELKNPKQLFLDPERPVRGKADAPVVIVEYSDFQCPYCIQAAKTIEKLLARYPGVVRLAFKHLPLERHEQAMIAARYFEAVAMQDKAKAWLLHDDMFADPKALEKGGEEHLKKLAADLGLDMDRLARDVKSEVVARRIESDREEADRFGFRGTPHFLVAA